MEHQKPEIRTITVSWSWWLRNHFIWDSSPDCLDISFGTINISNYSSPLLRRWHPALRPPNPSPPSLFVYRKSNPGSISPHRHWTHPDKMFSHQLLHVILDHSQPIINLLSALGWIWGRWRRRDVLCVDRTGRMWVGLPPWLGIAPPWHTLTPPVIHLGAGTHWEEPWMRRHLIDLPSLCSEVWFVGLRASSFFPSLQRLAVLCFDLRRTTGGLWSDWCLVSLSSLRCEHIQCFCCFLWRFRYGPLCSL